MTEDAALSASETALLADIRRRGGLLLEQRSHDESIAFRLHARGLVSRTKVPGRPLCMWRPTTKTCIDCREEKPADEFYPVHKDAPQHRQSRCKPCDNRKRADNNRSGDVAPRRAS